MPPRGNRSAADHEHMLITQMHVKTNNEIIQQLQAQIAFLLPHAAKSILHDQIVRENPQMQAIQDSFDVMAKLIEPRLDQAIIDVVEQRRVDLLEKFYK